MSTAAALHAIRHPGLVTAAGALAWLAGSGGIGYLLAADRAEWFRSADGIAHGPDGPRDLAGTYELYATCGTGQLRWFHQDGGEGQAVCLGEDPAALPPGEPADAPGRRRLPAAAERILAGRVIRARDGWATLATARYPSCEVPVTASPGQEVWATLAEYAVRDVHGNVSVTDTLLLSLAARTPPQSAKEHRA